MRNDETGEFYTPTTSDQKLYKIDGRLKAEIDVYITSERTKGETDPPSIAECRHAVLQIMNGSREKAYVIYDRLLGRSQRRLLYAT
jgi:hypothetical protein